MYDRKKYIYNFENNNFIISDQSADYSNVSFSLPQIVWVITDKCNYKCPFCFQPKTNTEFNIDYLDNYIELYRKLGVQKIDISGGEPMYNKNLIRIISSLLNVGINATISTNGSGNKTNREWIATNASKLSRVIVSLNGMNEKHNDSLCGQAGAYQRFLSFIKLLKNNNCKNLRINTVVTRSLITEDALKSIASIIRDISPKEWCLIEPHPDNKLPTFDEHAIDNYSFQETITKAEEMLTGSQISVIHRSIQNYAGYWILNPDGTVMLHSKNSYEIPRRIQFKEDNISMIEMISQESGIWVPSE